MRSKTKLFGEKFSIFLMVALMLLPGSSVAIRALQRWQSSIPGGENDQRAPRRQSNARKARRGLIGA